MISLSTTLAVRSTDFLTPNSVNPSRHRFSIKWLRYYLNICTKYSFKGSETDSLSAFLIQLHGKNQQPFMLNLAKAAITLFWTTGKSRPTPPRRESICKPLIAAMMGCIA